MMRTTQCLGLAILAAILPAVPSDLRFGMALSAQQAPLYVPGPDGVAPSREYYMELGRPKIAGWKSYDINNDGLYEIVVATGIGINMPINDGMGRSPWRYLNLPPGWSPQLYATWHVGPPVDLNFDGSLDLLVMLQNTPVNPNGINRVIAAIGDGRGEFVWDFSDRMGGAVYHSPRPAYAILGGEDLSGDGIADIIFLYLDEIRVFVGDVQGQFRELVGAIPQVVAGSPDFQGLTLADMDGDGDLDFVACTSSLVASYLFRNDGSGHFSVGFRFPGVAGIRPAIGDVNGDGVQDILFDGLDRASLTPQFYLGDGQGGYTWEPQRFPAVWTGFGGSRRHPSNLFDVDFDGDLDAFLYELSGQHGIFLNDGTGQFTSAAQQLGLASVSPFADVDSDGDMDTWDHVNTHRQITTNRPVVGGTLEIDLYTDPGNVVSYLLGFQRADLRIEPFGWLRLDPNTMVPWPSAAVVDATRRFRTTLGIPNVPNLRGLRMWAQGIDVDPQGAIRLMGVWPIEIR